MTEVIRRMGAIRTYIDAQIAKARLDALEEAAQACDGIGKYGNDSELQHGADACAEAIRNLADTKKLKETGT